MLINSVEDEQLRTCLVEIYNSIQNCSQKITFATKFIDFFVHDILDYTILNKNEQNFTKNIDVFNIKTAVNEIRETFEDKIEMKQIEVKTKFVGFKESDKFLIKTDKKRL